MKTKKIEELLNKFNKDKNYPISIESFTEDCKRYIKASRDNRIVCSIDSVSQSGMSRTMKFLEMDKCLDAQYHVLNFYLLFDALGFTKVKNSDYFRIKGCGMDMVFATHYDVISDLENLGFITAKTRKILEQKIPHSI